MSENPSSLSPIIWSLFLGGLLGGIVAMLRERRLPTPERDPAHLAWLSHILTSLLPLLQGLAAAGVVPLFLSLTKSRLLEDAISMNTDRAVLFGLAVVTSVSARSFLDGITKRALQDIEANKKDIADTKEHVESIEAELDEGGGSDKQKPVDKMDYATDATPALSDDEKRVLIVMQQSKWIKRTISGLERDLGDSKPVNLTAIINELVSKGLLIRHEPTPKMMNVRWSLSPGGKRFLHLGSD